MSSRHYRWPTLVLAALFATGIVVATGIVGCEGDDDWEHPNRQRYAAPPEPTHDSMSVEELERTWRERDKQMALQAQPQQVQPQQVQPQQVQPQPDQLSQNQLSQDQRQQEGQETTREMLDVALGYVEGALEALISNSGSLPSTSQSAGQQDAVGGGPTATPPANATPPVERRSGEM
jgi:hypothetical protein